MNISTMALKTRMDVFNILIIHKKDGVTNKDVAKEAVVITDALMNYEEGKGLDKALKIA